MKILHVVGDSKFGGGSVIIGQIVLSQLKAGFDVEVLSTDLDFKKYLAEIGVNVIELDCIHRNYNLFTDFLGIYKLKRFLDKSRYDVVHTHTTKAGFVGRVSARLSNVNVILHTVHGFPFSESSNRLKVFVFSFLEKLLFKISTKVVFVSNYHLSWARKLGITYKDRGIVIRNGVNKPSGSFSSPINNGKCIKLFFVGRVVREKGVFDLVLAFRKLSLANPMVELFFIGDGPDLNELKNFSEDIKNITYTGFVNNVADYLSQADIFVLPSYREGLSVSAIEAQACGIPSVLSNIGGNMEVSDNGKCALLFELGNVDSLYHSLNLLVSSEELRADLSSKSEVNFRGNYTNENMVSSYLTLYEMCFSSYGND